MEDFAKKLQAPFAAKDIEWRVQQGGVSGGGKPYALVLAYVTNRAIQSRLDDVFGVFGWKNVYNDMDGKGVECGISIYNHKTSEWITKYDAADETDIEGTKGGRSNAMKRAAVQLGIGRYLYKLDATFADCADNKTYENRQTFKPKQGQPIYGSWKTPDLPKWALPDEDPQEGKLTIAQTMLMMNDAFGCSVLSKLAEESGEKAQTDLYHEIKSTVGDGLKSVVADRFQELVKQGEELEAVLVQAVSDSDKEQMLSVVNKLTTATKRLYAKYDPETSKAIKELLS